ncbi:Pr6Pr family membrane protein [Pseudomonas sp. WS 5059]|jgi:hypothetical protein|uniref:Pr6Pr family membrane protein n=1 Tax=unclassified Pseudomonas TaxID=196821 RepID=UPI0014755928|nr:MULTISPECIES: Pr6Pr family membrane protein [unclassified Pseudomonas]NMX86165.1 Pr6Pr family membrane protein [Pseudomonas sp. WS 5010]NMY02735.1 Pr6Pr family membrane protein [Pseudomonas sp. WS 5059]
MKRYVAAAALAGWAGLAIQQYLILYSRWLVDASLLGGLVNFFSFFTVLSNTLAAVVLSYALVSRPSAGRSFFLQPAVSSGVTVSIVVVGLAYSVLLRHLWSPEGWQFIADELLHDVMPLLFLGYWWWCVPKGTLRFGHIGYWVIYPLVYFVYVLLRGHVLGQYQYPFIDVGTLGYPQVFMNAGGILLGFVAVALAIVGLDKLPRATKN